MAEEALDVQETEHEEQEQEELSTEERARMQGWMPENEWDREDRKWVDAETYLKRGESIQPILRERLKTTEKKLSKLEKDLEDARSANMGLNAHYDRVISTLKKQHETEIKRLKKDMRAAAAEGDMERYTELEGEMETLQSTAESTLADMKPVEDKQPGQISPEEIMRVRDEWIGKNEWFLNDFELHREAKAIAEFLTESRRDLTGMDQLNEVTKMIKERYPEKFGNPRRKQPGAVAGGEAYASTESKGKKSFADLPPEAKKECDRLCKEIKDFTRDEYLKYYDWS